MKNPSPSELVVIDLDNTLYRSPQPPTPNDETWWFHAYSFGKPGMPGFDNRWILGTLVAARRASQGENVMTAVLTARLDHPEMRRVIMDMLALTGIVWDVVQLKPVIFAGSSAEYKSSMVANWLRLIPTIQKVTVYDDRADVLEAIRSIVEGSGRQFLGVQVSA